MICFPSLEIHNCWLESYIMYSLHLSGLVVRRGKIYFFAQDLPSIMNTHTHTHIQRIDLDCSTFLDMNTGTKYDCLPAHSPQQWLGCPYHVANLILGLQGGCLPSLRFASSVVGNQHQSPMGWGSLHGVTREGSVVLVYRWRWKKKRNQLIERVCSGQLIISGWSPSDAWLCCSLSHINQVLSKTLNLLLWNLMPLPYNSFAQS